MLNVMETIKCIQTRRSKRRLFYGEVKKDIIETIIDCGRLSPSAINIQPCEFVVITDKIKLKRISDIVAKNGPFIKDAAFCVIVISKEVKYYLEDGCAATENILLAVHDFGLSSCWVAGDKKDYAEDVIKEIGVPEGYKIVSIIPVGYSEEKSNIQKRKLSEVIHWERF